MLYLTPSQERLRDDIRGLIKGEIRCDEVTLQLYSTDSGMLQSKPQGVVYPRDVDDIIACTNYAAARGISLHARGAGVGRCGGAIGSGIIIDFSRFMRQIVSLGHDYVVVQPGIVRYRLNELLARLQNRMFGPVSGFEPTATIGGILARNGAGANWLRYGFPSNHVLELKIVTASGNILKLDRHNLPEAIDPESIANNNFPFAAKQSSQENNIARGIAFARSLVLGREHTLADEIYRVLNPAFEEIRSMNTLPAINTAGYAVNDVLTGLQGRHVDIARLICGSEGTLGLIVEAKLQTVSIPLRRAGAVLFFDSFERVARAVKIIQTFRPALCELFDRRQLNLALEWKPRFRDILPADCEAALLIELDAGVVAEPADAAEFNGQMTQLMEKIMVKESLCKKTLRIESPEQFVLFDEFRHRGSLVLFQMQQSYQPLPIFDDVAIPVTIIQDFIPALLNLLKRHEITASLSGHVAQGHLRITPIIDLSLLDFVQRLRFLAYDVYMLVIGVGGSISSDCGDGYLKSNFLPQQYPALMPVFKKIKEIFDPNNILNPGKIIPDNKIWTQRLRSGLNLRGSNHPERFDASAFKIEDNLSGLFLLEAQHRDAELASKLAADSDGQNNSNLSDTNKTENNKNDNGNVADEAGINVTKNSGNAGGARKQLELQLKWEPERFFQPAYLCNGCGDCLRLDRRVRMCPVFRRHPDEDAAPRSKANLLRGLLGGELELNVLTSERVSEVADFCLHCKMCSVECPAAVNTSQLSFNCKGFHAAATGLALEDLFFSRIDGVLGFLSILSYPVNWATSNPVMRWLIEKLLQIPRNRKLPTLAKIPFLTKTKWTTRLTNVVSRNFSEPIKNSTKNSAKDSVKNFTNDTDKDFANGYDKNSVKDSSNDFDKDFAKNSVKDSSNDSDKDSVKDLSKDSVNDNRLFFLSGNIDGVGGSGVGTGVGLFGRRVAIFVDTYLNYFDVRLVELAVRILEHNGFEVYIPVRQRSSGLQAFVFGDRDRAERLVRHNVLFLSDLIRQGYRVVAIEPSTASCIVREYGYVVDDIDVALVSSNVVDFCDFLYRVYLAGGLRLDFRAIHLLVAYHAPCRAIVNSVGRLDVPTPAESILRLIPELEVRRIERGCCGMAGTFGMKLKNYHRSVQIGLPLVKEMRAVEIDAGVTDCMSCKLQLEQGTNKKILHPITLIAAAYNIIQDKDIF
ncbi:MAG: FAD-binding protein [Planctomycetaceae bacterium]|jgi:FAD/FMN-containing dehydrogenase/Fe-S oxidoreductase|nr:FAD-binding protein [Planctomycetaceae bacterium]